MITISNNFTPEVIDLQRPLTNFFSFLCSYKPLGYHKIGKTGDRVELYGISRDDILGASDPLPNPECIERSRPQLKTYIDTANRVVDVVLGHLERHLKLPQGTFAKLQPMTEPSGSVLRMLKYEPQVSKNYSFPSVSALREAAQSTVTY